MKTALTIAGSDSSGGAGIQADMKTMIANGVYAMSAITALTAQNTTGVQGIFEVTPEFLEQEIDSIFTDVRPDAVKIGMVSSTGLIEVRLSASSLANASAPHSTILLKSGVLSLKRYSFGATVRSRVTCKAGFLIGFLCYILCC